jgi:8-oxo-dGTP pyrophosphatase MutT (NUDIX family)
MWVYKYRGEGMDHRVDMTNTGIQRFRPAIYGVLIQDGQVLLVRAPRTFLGVVGFPGGGIELGEAPLTPCAASSLRKPAWRWSRSASCGRRTSCIAPG